MKRLVSVLVVVSACATVHGSSPQLFSGRWRDVANVKSTSNGAEVWVDGQRYGATPAAVDLDKRSGHEVSFKRAGYRDMSIQLARSVSARHVIFDVIDGRVPVVVDADTQSWYALDENALHATLQLAGARDEGVTARGTLTEDQLNRLVAGAPAAMVIDIPKVAR